MNPENNGSSFLDHTFIQTVDPTMIEALDIQEFSSAQINSLYLDSELTADEYLVLDFIGVNGLSRNGLLTVSFQGMKRIIALHQARLTKACQRLVEKDYLRKEKIGYSLTDSGVELYKDLLNRYKRPLPKSKDRNRMFVNIANGLVQGPKLYPHQYKDITTAFTGKWFGKYRYVSKIDYPDSFEICWLSTNGSISASMKVGPDNKLQIKLSAPIWSMASDEIQLLIDHVSQILESALDAPVIINEFSSIDRKSKEIDNATVTYAG